jgi:hypothetical protein
MATLEIFINERGPYLGTLNIETEQIDITMGRDTYKLDPKWTFVDKAGHFHAVTGAGNLPTLERYEKHIGCDGTCGGTCDGTLTETRYRCRACGKRVKPGFVVDVPGGQRRTMPGLTSWLLDVQAHEEPPSGKVSIRCTSTGLGGRDWFGIAEGRTAGSIHADGVARYSWQAYGVTELGRRP